MRRIKGLCLLSQVQSFKKVHKHHIDVYMIAFFLVRMNLKFPSAKFALCLPQTFLEDFRMNDLPWPQMKCQIHKHTHIYQGTIYLKYLLQNKVENG